MSAAELVVDVLAVGLATPPPPSPSGATTTTAPGGAAHPD